MGFDPLIRYFYLVFVVNTETMHEQRTKFTATVTDLKPPPAESLMVERVQGRNGSGKNVKSPITATSYTVASLQTATNSFSQEFLIGEGSLGRVYRADFSNGKVFLMLLVLEIISYQRTLINCYDLNESPILVYIFILLCFLIDHIFCLLNPHFSME